MKHKTGARKRTRSRNPPRGKVDHGQPLEPRGLLDEMERRLYVLGERVQLLLVHDARLADLAVDRAFMAHGLDDVARARLALGADERRALGDAPQGLAEVARAAHEGHFEGVLVDVVLLVGGRQHLRLVDVVDADVLQDLRIRGEVRAVSRRAAIRGLFDRPAPRQSARCGLWPSQGW